ncbi:MAG: hypothetical protein LJE83_04405 [Gammaproteobacteria bacterium]|nr:hypothetical protein [Gammaproteobacteria bacterium]
MELLYNRQRLYQTAGHKTPIEYEMMNLA